MLKTNIRVACRYGSIRTVRLRSLPLGSESKLPRAIQIRAGQANATQGTASAYIVFADTQAAVAALQANMTLFDGCHLRVDRAAPPAKKAGAVHYDHKRSVFVGNLAKDTTVRSLRQHLPLMACGHHSCLAQQQSVVPCCVCNTQLLFITQACRDARGMLCPMHATSKHASWCRRSI